MGEIRIRPATLADAAAITAVHCSHVEIWRRGGKGEPASYASLSLYDRWLHGGPWMSVETCAVHLNRWLRAGHPVLVAEGEGEADDLPFHLALAEHQRLQWGCWRVALPGGGTAWLGLHAQPLGPSQADGFIWAPPGAGLGPAIAALQTLAHQLEFAYVDLLLEEPEGQEVAATRGFEPQNDLTLLAQGWMKNYRDPL